VKITIAGYGYVGKALEKILSRYHQTEIIDPKYTNNKIKKDTDAVVVCVGTPEGNEGVCNMRHVHEVVRDCPDVPILIKSTISLEGWNYLIKTYDKRLAFSPEFLREAHAMKDVEDCDNILLGGAETEFWKKIFIKVYRNIPYIHVADPQELILAKYFRNAFLATKISFFNQIYDLCKASNIDYNAVRLAVCQDLRVNGSHSLVTKERGFGGHCFPKDTKAILQSALYYGVNLSILKEVVEYNQTLKDGEHENKKN
tara:strand:+ start:216 stop:983 length:768 start_codon:yes stop_codon:yes gene_type:complete